MDRGSSRLLPAETYKGKRPLNDLGHFNPLTHEYHASATPRDSARASGRKSIVLGASLLTPRINPLTQKLDPLNSTREALQAYDPRMILPTALQVVPRTPRVLGADVPPPDSTPRLRKPVPSGCLPFGTGGPRFT